MVDTTPPRYPPGVTNTRPPTTGYPRGVANPTGRQPINTTPPQATTVGQMGPQRPGVGQNGYDIWAINDLLRNAGYDGWQIIGTTPIQSTTEKANPVYDPGDPASGPPTTSVPKNEFVINIRDPRTNEIKQLSMGRKWALPGGGQTDDDPGTGADYSYQLHSLQNQQTAGKVGHTDMRTIAGKIYGTNAQTGAFELVPGAPDVPEGWSQIKQVDLPDGSTGWRGIDPADQNGGFKPVPGLPDTPAAAKGWGNPFQVTDEQGNQVWYGIDPADKQPKAIPGMPTSRKPTGPASATVNNRIYVQKPDGTYEAAQGIPDPNPPKGTTRITLGDDGFLYQNIANGDGTWQPDATFSPVAYTDAAKASQTKTGGLHKPGEQGVKVINGVSYPVVYRGGGDENYDVVSPDQGGKAQAYPGATPSSIVQTSTDQPYILRHNYDTGKDEPVANPNYQPTDPAKQVSQISDQATAKLQELQGKIGPTYTQEQAQADFDRWWNATVEPAKAQISANQQQKALDAQLKVSAEQRAIQAQQQSAYSTASQVGQNAVANYQAAQKDMVGANWGTDYFEPMMKAIQSGQSAPNIPASAFQYQGYDPNQLAEYYTSRALAHISPTAAQIANNNSLPTIASLSPNLDINSLLSRGNYQFQPPAPPQPQQQQGGGGVTVNVVAPSGQQPGMGQTMTPTTMNPTVMPGYTPPEQSQYAGIRAPSPFGNYQPSF